VVAVDSASQVMIIDRLQRSELVYNCYSVLLLVVLEVIVHTRQGFIPSASSTSHRTSLFGEGPLVTHSRCSLYKTTV